MPPIGAHHFTLTIVSVIASVIASVVVIAIVPTIASVVSPVIVLGFRGSAHVNPRGGGMGPLGDGVVHTNPSTIQLQTIAILLGLHTQKHTEKEREVAREGQKMGGER